MARSWLVWVAFSCFLAVVLAALAWISRAVLELDAARDEAQQQAVLEENVRLALWRIDSALAPLLAEESARPRAVYEPFYVTSSPVTNDRLLVPSPLLVDPPEHALIYFQCGPDQQPTSPQVPSDYESHAGVPPEYPHSTPIPDARKKLAELRAAFEYDRVLARLPPQSTAETRNAQLIPPSPRPKEEYNGNVANQSAANQPAKHRGKVEYQRRAQTLAQTNSAALVQNQLPSFTPWLSPDKFAGAPVTPLWLGNQLLLARRVNIEGDDYIQGCLLDWPALKRNLLDSVRDLLPEAELQPVSASAVGNESRRLAALPVEIVPGRLPVASPPWLSPLRLSLLAAWTCVILAAASVAALLWGVMRLSRRRAAFVSAVTHELRTPLTTFRMYAEMLAEDMLSDPAQRRAYLETLQREAARLTHLVENVLTYARLERRRFDRRREMLNAWQLMARVVPRLQDRAAQAEMQLVVSNDEGASGCALQTNPGAVEQILFNLVDNACKYATASDDKRIHLDLAATNGKLEFSVRDHGPGISSDVAGRLFRPFAKSARDAAESAPGVGLGLALSRRLARQLGGQLVRQTQTDGAGFVLRLPAHPSGKPHT